MKVLFDAQAFGIQDYGGVSTYLSRILHYMNSDEAAMPFFFSDNVNIGDNKHLSVAKKIKFSGKKWLYRCINKYFAIRAIKKNDFDIFHPTYFDPYFLKYLKKPFVVTIYDMTHEKYSGFHKYDKTIENKKIVAEKADKIIAISENTKKDIVELLGISEEKVEVVYLAFDSKKDSVQIRNFDEPYILFVGQRKGYKNFEVLVSELKGLLLETNTTLLCAGGGDFSELELDLFRKYGVTDKIKYVNINKNINSLYSNAICFIYSSLYEGFGIPILEGFSNECPVILSNRSCFPEIGVDACLYFDPDNSGDLEHKVRMIMENKELRDKMISRGNKRFKDFSWHKTAINTCEVYKSVLGDIN